MHTISDQSKLETGRHSQERGCGYGKSARWNRGRDWQARVGETARVPDFRRVGGLVRDGRGFGQEPSQQRGHFCGRAENARPKRRRKIPVERRQRAAPVHDQTQRSVRDQDEPDAVQKSKRRVGETGKCRPREHKTWETRPA